MYKPLRRDWVDAAIAVAAFVLFTAPVLVRHGGEGPAWAITVLGAAVVAPLVVRRRWPLPVLFAVVAVLAVAALGSVRFTPFVSNAGPAVSVAVYTVAANYPRRTAAAWSISALLSLGVVTVVALGLHLNHDQDATQWLLAIPAWLVGDLVRQRRGYRHELARQRVVRSAEQEARIRAEERLRVSRDVHDVVSHTLSMIAVRSGVARRVADSNPREAREALATIETASRAALDELRAVLRATRDQVLAPPSGEPRLSDLPQLANTARAAGLVVQMHVRSRAGAEPYPPMLETTVYRVVQEALTNVVKHGHARHVQVDVSADSTALRVTVADDGVGRRDAAPDGMGTVGMRERVDLFGGQLDLRPSSGGGHLVMASFPLEQRHD